MRSWEGRRSASLHISISPPSHRLPRPRCAEYLSPELIFNLGHDQSSDLWALGVLVYEMVMASTPFAPKKADNVTELFTNIAMVTKSGLHLSSRLDNKTRDPEVRSIISQLLKAEPSEYVPITP